MEEMWSRLPFELVMVVLACLPYRSLVRFKSVCKLWNSLPSTACFQQVCQQLPLHAESYLLSFVRPNVCRLYAPTTRQWHKIGLKFPKVHSMYKVRAADGGLFCITEKARKDDFPSWIVYNPLLNSSRRLPALPHKLPDFVLQTVDLTVDRCTKTYKVIVISTDDDRNCHWRTHIYDSICECWTETGNMPTVGYQEGPKSVICGPTLFALLAGRYGPDDHMLMACDIGSGAWTKVAIQKPNFNFYGLLESGGRLLLCGTLDNICMCVWEFKVSATTDAEWVEIARLSVDKHHSLTAVSHDNLIFFCISRFANPLVVMYDMNQQTWTSPQEVIPPHTDRIRLVSWVLSLGANV